MIPIRPHSSATANYPATVTYVPPCGRQQFLDQFNENYQHHRELVGTPDIKLDFFKNLTEENGLSAAGKEYLFNHGIELQASPQIAFPAPDLPVYCNLSPLEKKGVLALIEWNNKNVVLLPAELGAPHPVNPGSQAGKNKEILHSLLTHLREGDYSSQVKHDAERVISCLQWIKCNIAYIEYFVDHKNDCCFFNLSRKDAEKGIIRDHNGTSMHLNSYANGKQAKHALEAYIDQFEQAFLIAQSNGYLPLFVHALEYDEKVGCIEARTSRALEIATLLATTGRLDLDMLFADFEKQERNQHKDNVKENEKWQRAYKYFGPIFYEKSKLETRVSATTATALNLSNNEDILIELDRTHIDDYLLLILGLEPNKEIASLITKNRLLQLSLHSRKAPQKFINILNRITAHSFSWETTQKYRDFLFLVARWQPTENFIETVRKIDYPNPSALWRLKNTNHLNHIEDGVSLFRVALMHQRFESLEFLWTEIHLEERICLLTMEEGRVQKPNIHIGLQHQKTLQDVSTLLEDCEEQTIVKLLTTPNNNRQNGIEIFLIHQKEAAAVFFLLAHFNNDQLKRELKNKSQIGGSHFQIAFLCQPSEVIEFLLKNYFSNPDNDILFDEIFNKNSHLSAYLDSEYFSHLQEGDSFVQVIAKRKLPEPMKKFFSCLPAATIKKILCRYNSLGENGFQTIAQFLPEVIKFDNCLRYFKAENPNISEDIAYYQQTIKEINGLVKEERFLIKMSAATDFFINMLANYNYRPPLRKVPPMDATKKFRHLTGEIETYTPKKNKVTLYTHTRKTSMTWIDPSLSTPLISSKGVVGFGLDINHCLVKAVIASSTARTYHHEWIGSQADVQKYAEFIKEINFTDLARFFQEIKKKPQMNEILARVSREALRCVILTKDDAAIREVALKTQELIQQKLNRHVPIVFYDLPNKQLHFLYDKAMTRNACSLAAFSHSRKRLHLSPTT